jgi:hypothetical protein
MVKIVGTRHGRIFMGGSDGSLYELEYQVLSLSLSLVYMAPRTLISLLAHIG